MRAFLIFLALLGCVAALAAAVYFKVDFHFGPYATVCKEDDEIDAADRTAIDNAATAFLQSVMSDPPHTVIGSMSEAGRRFTTAAQLQQFSAVMREQSNMSAPVAVKVFQVSSTGAEQAALPCETAFVAAGGTGRTAHVLLERRSRGGVVTYAVFMEYERGGWRARGVWQGSSTYGGHDGDDLWRMAKAQRQNNHLFNASVLYGSADAALQRGSWVRLMSRQDFDAESSTFTRPSEFAGNAPWVWTSSQGQFSITGIDYVGVDDGRVVLDVHQRLPQWPGDAGADAANRKLIDFINASYPEWKEIADTLAVRTEGPQPGAFYGDIYSRDTGQFNQPPAPAPAHPGQD